MKLPGYAIIAFLISVIAFGCTDRRVGAPVPRPTAYPRAVDPGTEYIKADSLPVVIEVNSSAVVTRPGQGWLDIAYPDLGAAIHMTIIPTTPGDIDNIVANRSERISLNLADAAGAARDIALESADFTSTLIVAPDARNTPLQFLSTDGSDWVITGVVFFRDVQPDASVDSLSQAVGFIRRDLEHTLTHLSR